MQCTVFIGRFVALSAFAAAWLLPAVSRAQTAWDFLRREGGADQERATALVPAPEGGVYLAGIFNGSTHLGFADDQATTLTVVGMFDSFIARYDAQGTMLWARRMGGPFEDSVAALAATEDGGVLATGWTTDRIQFEGLPGLAPVELGSPGRYIMFLVKYSPEGGVVWYRHAQSDYFPTTASGLLHDPRSGTWVTGGISEAVFSPRMPDHTEIHWPTYSSLFLAKYDPSPALSLIRMGIRQPTEAHGHALASTQSGDVIVSGYARDTVTFGLEDLAPQYTGGKDAIALARYRPNGELVWAKSTSGSGLELPQALSATPDDGVFLLGNADSTVTLGVNTATSFTLSVEGSHSMLLARLAADGTPRWAKMIGATIGLRGLAMATHSKGNVIVAGEWLGTTTFGLDPGQAAPAISEGVDGFVAFLAADGVPEKVNVMSGPGSQRVTALTVSGEFIWAAGDFEQSIHMGDGSAELSELGRGDIFLAQIRLISKE